MTQANESIYVESVTEHLKISLLTNEECYEFKRYPDEDYQAEQYLRNRFGRSMAGEATFHLDLITSFFFQVIKGLQLNGD